MPYQIITFEPGRRGRNEALRAVVTERFRDLNIDLETMVAFLSDRADLMPDPKAPAVAVYFGGEVPADDAVRACLRRLLVNSITVVPVVDDLGRFQQLVPEELHPINGLAFNTAAPNYEAIAGRLLEALFLLRESRRLFISYKRSESHQVAIELYEELDAKGFDVFLDTVSMRPGDEFQKVLAHRLADVDVIVLLHTRDFVGSRWTIQEFTQATAMGVAILRLEWPEIRRLRTSRDRAERARARRLDEEASLTVPFPLARTDFDSDGRLRPAVTRRVSERVEGLRARALAARQASLTREFTNQAREHGFWVYPQPEQFLRLNKPRRKDVAVFPAVGAPSATTYQRFHDVLNASAPAPGAEPPARSKRSSKTPPLYVLYDHRALLAQYLKHLVWLDDNIGTVKGLRVAEAADILAGLR
jgi:hypothetical protein